jgi:hypothetical protein
MPDHILENGMPDGFDTALSDGSSVEVFKFIVPWKYNRNAVKNNGRWLWQILHALRNGCSRVVFEVGRDIVSVAMISSLFRFCMEVSTNIDVEVWKSDCIPVVQIEKCCWNPDFVIQPVIEKLQLNWRALRVRGGGLQRALEGDSKEGDDIKFFSDEGYRHPWSVFSRNKLRARQLSFGTKRGVACSTGKMASELPESVPPFENVFLEEFRQHLSQDCSLSYREKLGVTCLANREFRKEIRRVVDQMISESRVLLFPSKRPAWLLPEISTAIVRMRIAGERFAGRDAKVLLDLLLTDDDRNGERVDAFVATCMLPRDDAWGGSDVSG